MPIVSLPDAKQQLNIPADYIADDDELVRFIGGLDAIVEDYVHEVPAQRTVVEDTTGNGFTFRLWATPVISLTSVTSLDGATTYDVAGMHASQDSGLVRVLSGSAVSEMVTVTYEAGYATVPANYRQGALLILQHVWETQRGAMGTPRGLVVGDEEIYDPRSGFTLPRRALEWLGGRRPIVA